MGAVSRLNLYTWFSGPWGLLPDAKGGVPYMILEALRLQRQHLLTQKQTLKPLSLSLLGHSDDRLLHKSINYLQEQNKQSHTASIKANTAAGWQDIVKQLQPELQRQPSSERNLLLLDPLALDLPPFTELLQLLPKKLDIILVLPFASLLKAGREDLKEPLPDAVLSVVKWISPLLNPAQAVADDENPADTLLQQLKHAFTESSKRFVMHYPSPHVHSPIVLFGLTHDSLMMEKMIISVQKLKQQALEERQAGLQLGLFGAKTKEQPTENDSFREQLLKLLARQPEWNNQELYQAMLHEELLPREASPLLQALHEAGQLEVLDEKKKKLKSPGTFPINQTAYKLPAPSRYFRLV